MSVPIRSEIHIKSLLSVGKKLLASQFNFTYRNIDDALSINNPDFDHYPVEMYPAGLDIKDTTVRNTSASYMYVDILLSIGRDGQLHTSLYEKRDDFKFHITNSPFLNSKLQYSIFASLWRLYLTAHTVWQGLHLLWIFDHEGDAIFIYASRAENWGTFEIDSQVYVVLRSILESHQTLWI